MTARPGGRQSLPWVPWLLLAIVVALLCIALGLLVWHKTEDIEALRTELGTVRSERRLVENQLTALQGTATAMESRLSELESSDTARQLADLQRAVESATDTDRIAELRASLAQVQSRVDSFQSALDDLSARIDSLGPPPSDTGLLPAEARLRVAPQRQTHNLSCESAAASMAARYQGVGLSEAEILAALPRNANPNLGFRGNPDGPTGGTQDYGVYSGPVAAVLNARGLRAWPVSGGLDGIRAAIARGDPVLAWVTYHMAPSTPVSVAIDGRDVTLVPQQHVVVVTGYDDTGFWADDPWDGQEEFYAASEFARAMGYFGNMALEVAGP